MVNNHLTAAEKLSKHEAEFEKINSSNKKINPDDSVNKRLGSYLFPPERAEKFKTIFKDNEIDENLEELQVLENMTPDEIHNSFYDRQYLESQTYLRRRPFSPEDRSSWDYTCERPTHYEDDNFTEEIDKIDFSKLPTRYYEHWKFLKNKVQFYEDRLNYFYSKLQTLAFQRMESQNRFLSENKNYNSANDQMNDSYYLRNSNQLRKRSNEQFQQKYFDSNLESFPKENNPYNGPYYRE